MPSLIAEDLKQAAQLYFIEGWTDTTLVNPARAAFLQLTIDVPGLVLTFLKRDFEPGNFLLMSFPRIDLRFKRPRRPKP